MVAENPVVVREFDAERDCPGVEALETMCEVGSNEAAIITDHLGDPLCRVRRSPAFLMLVAEASSGLGATEIIGVVRGCVKTVTCGKKASRSGKPLVALCTMLGYILGLRVSPTHRRMGVATELVNKMEGWFKEKGAEYSYMATEKDNEASVRLFMGRFGYSKFRTPSILVQPVFAHRLRSPRGVSVLRLPSQDAESLYRHRFSTVEFFPRDIDAVLNSPLSLGTFLAVPKGSNSGEPPTRWEGVEVFLADPPGSWAVVSVWDCGGVFRLEVRGASRAKRGVARASRALDRAMPWLGIPSVPDLFRPFGFYFLYGLGGEGKETERLVRALCAHAHNMAREASGCGVVATEVAGCEPLRAGIPHWRCLSCEEDLWCMKRLHEDYSDGDLGDWSKSPPGPSIFVDPREV